MIDGIRIILKDSLSFEKKILKSGLFNFSSKYSVTTGEIKDYPKTTEWKGFKINISEKSAFINGSLHKFYNSLCTNKNQNYDDFKRSQLNSTISKLQDAISELNNSHITMLEMGFNLEIPIKAKDLISYRVLMYDFNPHNLLEPYKNKGYLKEFRIGDYRWKIYDKSLQYKLDYPLIRIELKITNKRVLERFKIYNLQDLKNEECLRDLFRFFMKKFENLLIIDNPNEKLMSTSEITRLNMITNNSYWIGFTERKDSKRVIRHRKQLARDFIIAQGLDKTHNFLKSQLNLKFDELIKLN